MSILKRITFMINTLAFAASGVGGSFALADSLDSRLVGAWATSASECATLFQRSGGGWKYRAPVDKFAQAAIIRPGEIQAPAAVCRILSLANTKDGITLKAECNDSISIQTQTATIKIQSGSEMIYSPTGDPVLSTTFVRCP